MGDVEDEELSRAILLSLRENFRQNERYQNEDGQLAHLRYKS